MPPASHMTLHQSFNWTVKEGPRLQIVFLKTTLYIMLKIYLVPFLHGASTSQPSKTTAVYYRHQKGQ